MIDTDKFSEKLRARAVRVAERRLLVARLEGSAQEDDLQKPPNCGGFGRIRHFNRYSSGGDWPRNPLPIDPAARALGLGVDDELQAQVFQNAACNWRCWYCFVPFELLDAREDLAAWLTAGQLLDLFQQEPAATRPKMIDLTGGQPELVPEWVPWTMREMRDRGLEGKVYLWSDDNLSNDYFWQFLGEEDKELVSTFKGYGRVACFKGYDDSSFAFNTEADPALFARQFEIFGRLLAGGMDLFAYATFTAAKADGVRDSMRRFVDRLQTIDANLPLRTVPLKIARFGVVNSRLEGPLRKSVGAIIDDVWVSQQRAIEAWLRELEERFSSTEREMNIVDVRLGKRGS